MKIRLKTFDIIIILFVAGLTFFSAYIAWMKPRERSRVLIRGQGSEWVFPAEAAQTIVVPGPLGNTTVRLGDSRAWIESSPCGNQTCVTSGSLTRQGHWAACLPNNVLLIIQGIQDDDVDGIACIGKR